MAVVLVLALAAVTVLQPVEVAPGAVDRPTGRTVTSTPAVERAAPDRLSLAIAAPPTGATVAADGGFGSSASELDARLASIAMDLGAGDWRVPLGALLLGATKQAEGSPLDNDNRRRVYEQVAETPGAHIADIVEATDIPRSTVRYHLRVLEDASLIAGDTVHGNHRYAPVSVDLRMAAAVRDEPTWSVADAVARFEPVSLTGLAEELDRAPSTVSHHVDRLVDAGLLERERDGTRVRIRLHPDGRHRVEGVASDVAGGGPETVRSAE